MSSNQITDKQISDLDEIINQKLTENRLKRHKLNEAQNALLSIKMLPRQNEKIPAKPAKPGKPAVMDTDGVTELEPAVLPVAEVPAVMETVFDIMPKDPIVPNAEMNHARRKQILDAWEPVINTV